MPTGASLGKTPGVGVLLGEPFGISVELTLGSALGETSVGMVTVRGNAKEIYV